MLLKVLLNSNTTLVKVKFPKYGASVPAADNSNTTLVKVKYISRCYVL